MLKLCYICEKAIPDTYIEIRLSNPRKTEIYLFCSWDCLRKFIPVIVPAAQVKAEEKAEAKPVQDKPKTAGPTFNIILPHPVENTDRLYGWWEKKLDEMKEKGLILEWRITPEQEGVSYWITPTAGQEDRIKKDLDRLKDWLIKQLGGKK